VAIEATSDIFTAQEWPQGDERDPLGIWGGRTTVTGDATAGDIKITFQQPQNLRAAYVYAVYAAQVAHVSGGTSGQQRFIKTRLLTNWPNVDDQVGVQGFATLSVRFMDGSANATPPLTGPQSDLLAPNDRFVLLYDPRPGIDDVLALVEFEVSSNVLNEIIGAEIWGYYWDRSVLQAPGGPRHPGS